MLRVFYKFFFLFFFIIKNYCKCNTRGVKFKKKKFCEKMELSSEVTNTIPQLLVLSNSKLKKLLKLPIWSTAGLSKKKKCF